MRNGAYSTHRPSTQSGSGSPDGVADRERDDEDDHTDAGQPPGGLAPGAAARDQDRQRDDRQPGRDVLHEADSTA